VTTYSSFGFAIIFSTGVRISAIDRVEFTAKPIRTVIVSTRIRVITGDITRTTTSNRVTDVIGTDISIITIFIVVFVDTSEFRVTIIVGTHVIISTVNVHMITAIIASVYCTGAIIITIRGLINTSNVRITVCSITTGFRLTVNRPSNTSKINIASVIIAFV